MALTPAGERVRHDAEALLGQWDDLARAARRIHAAMPAEVGVSLRVGQGDLDAVVHLAPPTGWHDAADRWVLGSGQVRLLVHPRHRFVCRGRVHITELENEPVVMLERETAPVIVRLHQQSLHAQRVLAAGRAVSA